MRQECRNLQNVELASVQGYHANGSWSNSELYAFRGFKKNWYFNSDRKEETEMHDGIMTRKDGAPMDGVGLELEVECSGINRDDALAQVFDRVIFPNFKFGADMFKMQEDGSLRGRSSVEVITQVMTRSRVRNDYAAYKTMFDVYFPAFGINADSFETNCGMHVNISTGHFGKTAEEQAEAMRKLYYIVNKHYDFFVRAFHRDPSKATWCGQMTADNIIRRDNYPRSMAEKWDYRNAKTLDLENACPSHHFCMNYSHAKAGRIEIRLVGGQDKYYTFRNTMETVFHLIDKVRTIDWTDCDDLVKIFSGCNRYVWKRISEECSAFFTTEQLEKIQRKLNMKDDFELHR